MQFFMMHIIIKLTDDRNIRRFERILSENSIRLTDLRISAEFTIEAKYEKSNSNTESTENSQHTLAHFTKTTRSESRNRTETG